MRSSAFILLAAALHAQPPGTEAVLDSARTVALNYSKGLPNFTCTEVVSRFDDWSDRGAWTVVDKLTVELSFSGEREDYRLIARNGKPTNLTLEAVSGTVTRGEFGSVLIMIFQPSSETEFQWRRWETFHGKRLAEFTYRMELRKSHYILKSGEQTTIVPYHGTVDILPATGEVYRWTVEAEPPRGFPVMESSVRMEYDFRKIEDTEYLLPVHAEMRSTERGLSGKQLEGLSVRARNAAMRSLHHRNLVEFQNYRKFGVDSTVIFK
jgi:hypothetical protein